MSTHLKKTNRMIALLLVVVISLSGNVNNALAGSNRLPSGWQSYVDPDYGFKIGYPAQGWSGAIAFQADAQTEDAALKRYTIQNEESAFINIDVWSNSTGLGIPAWIDLHLKNLLDGTAVIPATSNITLNGMEGFLIVQPPNPEQQLPGRTIALLSTNGFIYQIEYIAQDGGAAQSVYMSALETFEPGAGSTQPRNAPRVREQNNYLHPQAESVEVQTTSTAFDKTSPANGTVGLTSTVTLKWDEPTKTPDKYRYAISTSKTSNDWTSVYDDTEVTIKNLSANTTYYWQIQAIYCDTCATKEIVSANDGTWWSLTVGYPYPLVTSINRGNPTGATTNALSVNYAVTFSRAVTGVDANDFHLLITGGITGASITDVTGSGAAYTVTVNTGSGDGTLRLNVVDDDTIKDAKNVPLGGTGVNNGNFSTGQVYTIDKTPSVVSSTLMNPNPTNTLGVNFKVIFSIDVTGVDASDFALTTPGITGASVTGVSGSGTAYTVTVNTGSGLGTVRLDVVDDNSIKDNLNNPLGGADAGDGNFTSGSRYTMIAPVRPTNLLPRLTTNNSTPTLTWGAVTGPNQYEVQLATDVGFTQNVNAYSSIPDASFTFSTALSNGKYYWHVRTYDARNSPSPWSATRYFTIDTAGPAAPAPRAPADGASVRGVPIFRWSTASDAVLYQFELNNSTDFTTVPPLFSIEQRAAYRRPPGSLRGAYYWRVRAQDAAGNWSGWSATFTINILPPR